MFSMLDQSNNEVIKCCYLKNLIYNFNCGNTKKWNKHVPSKNKKRKIKIKLKLTA